nr:endonuclease domain-containing 1 protein-like [Paramormyrops kingsleyae]
MVLLCLLTCVLLGALSAQAEVVQSFQNCSEFFYKGKEPTGMDENAQKICQKYGNHPNPFFATLYSEYHRIPLYSAYIFKHRTGNTQARKAQWFIEPQISGFNNYEMMSSESEFNISVIKVNQAINDDYKDTGYDRGHLNPYSFQVGDGRVATFTLTNAAPMDACFNRVHWKEWETELRDIIQEKLRADRNKATAYIVTGTIPTPSYRIPKKGEFDEDEERDLDRVTVPTHVWTALCYKQLENLKYVTESACLLTKVTRSDVECQQVLENSEIGSKTAADGTHCKSPVSPVYCVCESGSKHDKCLVVPEISVAEEMTTAYYWSGLRCCDTDSGLIPYCTSPCLYMGVQKGYLCYSGQSYIQCSPQYSLITAGVFSVSPVPRLAAWLNELTV